MNKRAKTEETVTSKSLKSQSTSYFDKLDDFCLVRIFSNLTMQKKIEIEKVCHRWKKIAEEKTWNNNTNLDLSIGSKIIEEEFNNNMPTQAELRGILSRCGRYLKHLKLSTFYDSSIMKTVRYNCSAIVTLDLDLSSYSRNHFIYLYSDMKKLESLKIKSSFSDDTFDYFHGICDKIKDIYLDAQGDPGKPPSLQKFKSLESLILINFELETKTIKEICQNKNLKTLSLRYCCVTKMHTDLSRIVSLRDLENLDLWQCPMIDDDLLTDISYKLKRLRYLNIGGFKNEITVSGVNLLRRLDKLESLTISCLNLNCKRGNINSNNNKLRLGPFFNLKILNCMGTRGLDDSIIIGILDNSEKLNKLIIEEAEVTAHVLECANTVTKKRANNVVLNVWVHDSVIEEYREFISSSTPSQYLVVRSLSGDFVRNKIKNIDFTFP